jgi:transcriptional regulator GlxA family with amidase domain
VDAIAARVDMSPRNFIRRFKDATGHTPLSYIQCVRVVVAKRLLENERQTVQEVGQTVAYEDQTFFRGYSSAIPASVRLSTGPALAPISS